MSQVRAGNRPGGVACTAAPVEIRGARRLGGPAFTATPVTLRRARPCRRIRR
jgi:hypothetical protein